MLNIQSKFAELKKRMEILVAHGRMTPKRERQLLDEMNALIRRGEADKLHNWLQLSDELLIGNP